MDEMVVSVVSCGTATVGAKCGRWNPTAEQVKVLTDLFSSGLRTPTTEQIQMISSRLSAFGKIESKNVFYWFQNHKARERHHKKRRRGGGGELCGIPRATYEKKETKSSAKLHNEAPEPIVWERREREIETLELFPLSSYNLRNEWRDQLPFIFGGEKDPPLDLRLSFL